MRIRRAVEHLFRGESLGRTAELVGYRTVRKFFSLFRTLVGVSPPQYVPERRLGNGIFHTDSPCRTQ